MIWIIENITHLIQIGQKYYPRSTDSEIILSEFPRQGKHIIHLIWIS